MQCSEHHGSKQKAYISSWFPAHSINISQNSQTDKPYNEIIVHFRPRMAEI